MRTNIDIDDELMKQAMEAAGATTKKAAVEAALRQMVQIKAQGAIRKLRGKVVWRGHDENWFASDEEARKKYREASSTIEPDFPSADAPIDQSELAADQGHR
ncbi:MAG: type II toxin-antitoxin system VapB family antitoxin [Terracidiphilus sp.]|jgi:Arc/MetJ family transcription regulator